MVKGASYGVNLNAERPKQSEPNNPHQDIWDALDYLMQMGFKTNQDILGRTVAFPIKATTEDILRDEISLLRLVFRTWSARRHLKDRHLSLLVEKGDTYIGDSGCNTELTVTLQKEAGYAEPVDNERIDLLEQNMETILKAVMSGRK